MDFKRIGGLGIAIILAMGIGAFGEDKKEALRENLYSSPEKATLEELFEAADCVVMGKVEKVKARKEIELLPVEIVKERLAKEEEMTGEKRMHLLEERRKREMVYTYVTLSPEEWFKNKGKEKKILIQVGGGMTENFGVFVHYIGGTPRFKEKQKVLVFLEKAPKEPYYWMLLGATGQYVVNKDKIYNFLWDKEKPLKDFLSKIKEIKDKEVKKE